MKSRKSRSLMLCTLFLVFIIILNVEQVQASDIYVLEADAPITDHLWSSDGTKVAYIKAPTNQLSYCEIWIAEWDNSELKNHQLIFSGPEAYGYALEDWQGEWILFQRDEPYPVARTLWKMRDDGSDLTKIAFMRSAYYGRFIPGTDLVYISAHNGNGWWRPMVCKADGSWQAYYVSEYPYAYSFTIGMSPTGNKLVWGSATYWDNPTNGLMASNVDGSEKVQLGSFPYRTTPLVLADGQTVVYRYIRTRGIGEPPTAVAGNIYAVNMDGTNHRTIIDDEYYNAWANYYPVDGQAFLMTSDRGEDGNTHIFSINVDGSGIEQITDGPYNDAQPTYSPDGKSIMYLRLPEDYVPDPAQQPYPYELVIKRLIIPVTIDIKPCSEVNPISLKSKGRTPVAVLTTDDFNVAEINPATIKFAGASPVKWAYEDIDQDGDIDLVLHFKTQELILTKFDTEATLIGKTFDGVPIEGTDSIRIVPDKMD